VFVYLKTSRKLQEKIIILTYFFFFVEIRLDSLFNYLFYSRI